MNEPPLVLIIEDDPDLARLYRVLLEMGEAPVRTDVCTDGRTGLERVQREPEPRLILLDLHLPHVQGSEIFRTARACTASTIVVITADILAAREMAASADHVVVKPFDAAVLRDFLAGLLSAPGRSG